MLDVVEASGRILAGIAPLGIERVALPDALGRVLASAVRSPVTIPAWHNSAMDGYAVRSEDVAEASAERPVTLEVLETVAAGAFPSRPVSRGTATRIMTGAPIPEGADSVLRVEDTDGGAARVTITDARDVRRNIRRRGEDIESGATVLTPGTPIGAAQIGLLASVGAASVDVHRRPRVAFLATGDEVVDLDRFGEALEGRKIVTSNSYTLHAMIRAAGGVPINLGISRDDPSELRSRIEGAAGCDLLITSAGISAGEYDYIRNVLSELGVQLDVWRVRMRPGAPLGFGRLGAMPWIGLPGNPVSTMVTFELFVRPMLRKMLGHDRIFRKPVRVVVEQSVKTGAPLTHFLRAVMSMRDDGVLTVRLTGPQGSGILTSMALANALLIVPHDRQHVDAGEVLHAIPITEDAQLSSRFAL
jgi:molybdopterin molybdotransferase